MRVSHSIAGSPVWAEAANGNNRSRAKGLIAGFGGAIIIDVFKTRLMSRQQDNRPDDDRVVGFLAEIRRERGVSAADLARDTGISRQTVHAIESGAYVPNTAVCLRLARRLDVPVERLFRLADAAGPEAPTRAAILPAGDVRPGSAVRVCDVGGRQMAVPVHAGPFHLPAADGLVARLRGKGEAEIVIAPRATGSAAAVVIAGCDPAIGIAASTIERSAGTDVVAVGASSRLALRWLHEGKVHIAGAHLRDEATGEFNLPLLRREYPRDDLLVVTFAHWEEGIVCASGNPKRIRGVESLARRDVRIVNREVGSGSRALLDRLLAQEGIPAAKVRGYDRAAQGHLAAAYAVFTGESDACLATGAAARAFGLTFLPIERERYDLVLKRGNASVPAVRAFLDVLQRSVLRRKLALQAGYDTASTGSAIA